MPDSGSGTARQWRQIYQRLGSIAVISLSKVLRDLDRHASDEQAGQRAPELRL